jgi:hypothetical protein
VLDSVKLALLHAAGGNIRHNAGFFAGESGKLVSMTYILHAHHEAGTPKRPLSGEELRGWV